MALIKCSECGNEVSDKAKACPNCGCPIEKAIEGEISPKGEGDLQNVDENEVIDDVSKEDLNNSEAEAKKVIAAEPAPKPQSSKRILIVSGIAAAIIIIGGIGIYFGTANYRNYTSAIKQMENKKYEEAISKFEKLGAYKDSVEMFKKSSYELGKDLFKQDKFEDARTYFEEIGDFEDAKEMVKECEYQLTTDGHFMRALSRGLMGRWEKNEEDTSNGLLGEDPTAYKEYCEIELNEIKSFYDMEFENPELGQDSKIYIDMVNNALDSLKYYTVDYGSYYELWSEAYAERTMLIKKFVENYGLVVDSKYQKTLDDLLIDAMGAEAQVSLKNTIRDMTKEFQLTSSTDEWGYISYRLQMTNTTEYTFDYFYVEISVLNSEGKIVNSGSASQVSSWQPGQEAEVDAYLPSDETVEGMNIQYIPHYQTDNFYE